MRVAGPMPNMIRPPALLLTAAACRRRTRAALQSGVRREGPLSVHCRANRQLQLRPTAVVGVVRCPGQFAFYNESDSDPASSMADLSADRTPPDSVRLLQPPP